MDATCNPRLDGIRERRLTIRITVHRDGGTARTVHSCQVAPNSIHNSIEVCRSQCIPWCKGSKSVATRALCRDILEKLTALVPPPLAHQVVSRIDLEVWRMFGAAHNAACGHHPTTPSAGRTRGGQPGRVSLGVGQVAPPSLCHRHGALSSRSAGHEAVPPHTYVSICYEIIVSGDATKDLQKIV